jgi:hypothetical protein
MAGWTCADSGEGSALSPFATGATAGAGGLGEQPASATPEEGPRADTAVEAGHRVGEVLDRYPDLLDTFLTFGFTPLANPLLRRTAAASVTVGRACRYLGVDPGPLLQALNAARAPQNAGRHPLPLASAEPVRGPWPGVVRPGG